MTRAPFRLEHKRFDAAKWCMLIAFFAFTYLIAYSLNLRPSSDLSIHTTWAGEGVFSDPVSFVRHGAHPMWHVLVAFVRLTGLPLYAASALVTAFCKAAEVWLIHRLLTVALQGKRSAMEVTAFSAICALVSAICLPFYNPTVYLGAGSPNTWHSPTQLISMVFMLLCVPYTAFCFDRFVELEQQQGKNALLPWRQPAMLGVLLFLSLLAKPTFMQAFLPASCLFFLVQWIRHPRNSKYFLQIIVCVLPSVIFMIFQYLYYFGIIVPWQASMVLQINAEKFFNTGIRVVLMLAFPLWTLWSCRKQPKDTMFLLTLIFNAVSIVEFLILGENGRRAADGNFGWGMMGAALMMWVVALIRFAGMKKRDWIGIALLAFHLLSGLYYLFYLLSSGNPL